MHNKSKESIDAQATLWQFVSISNFEKVTVQKNGYRYFLICGLMGHPIATLKGKVPFHRLVLWEKLGQPQSTPCHWCSFPLPWTSHLPTPQSHVVNADHVDGNTMNNTPDNLVASCGWCNANRNWAEEYPEFWKNWRRWLKDVPPSMRPSLAIIAKDFGIVPAHLREEEVA